MRLICYSFIEEIPRLCADFYIRLFSKYSPLSVIETFNDTGTLPGSSLGREKGVEGKRSSEVDYLELL
jgi:hypothetical protein